MGHYNFRCAVLEFGVVYIAETFIQFVTWNLIEDYTVDLLDCGLNANGVVWSGVTSARHGNQKKYSIIFNYIHARIGLHTHRNSARLLTLRG